MNQRRFEPTGGARRAALRFTRGSMRAVDQACIKEYGIPGVVLMENAAAALAECALELLADAPAEPLAILCCGPGNNGGDGFALARRLHNEGVRCVIAPSRDAADYTGDAAANLAIAQAMGLHIRVLGASPGASLDRLIDEAGEPRLIVDSMFGTGLDRPVKAPLDEVNAWINGRRGGAVRILAVDVPTGLDADTGRPLAKGEDAAVRADATVTLGGMKTGLTQPEAASWTGVVSIGDIGAPIGLLERLGERRPDQAGGVAPEPD